MAKFSVLCFLRSKKLMVTRLLLVVLAFCICTASFISLGLTTQAYTNKVIKVGYFEFEGYHEIDADGNRSGYGYDYLHEIAKYTGWSYEYIDGTWEECQKMLEMGEIDLVTSAQYNEARAKKI